MDRLQLRMMLIAKVDQSQLVITRLANLQSIPHTLPIFNSRLVEMLSNTSIIMILTGTLVYQIHTTLTTHFTILFPLISIHLTRLICIHSLQRLLSILEFIRLVVALACRHAHLVQEATFLLLLHPLQKVGLWMLMDAREPMVEIDTLQPLQDLVVLKRNGTYEGIIMLTSMLPVLNITSSKIKIGNFSFDSTSEKIIAAFAWSKPLPFRL